MKNLLRKNIQSLKAYSSARDEFKGEAKAFFDANESPYNSPFNRYPDPLQWKVKEKLAAIKAVRPEQIFLGNGSDEAIDLLYRAFCEPRTDNVVAIEPTYGMYQVCADINDVEYRTAPLDEKYELDAKTVLARTDAQSKIIWLCSPNNPTANLLQRSEVIYLLENFHGLVVVDEAYIDFASDKGFLQELNSYPNLVVLQTFSKAWGSAAIRLGMAFASEEIISVFNKIKYPYNVNLLTQQKALEMLEQEDVVQQNIAAIVEERAKMIQSFESIRYIRKTYPTDANFILVKVDDANAVYRFLSDHGIVIRNRNNIVRCEGCLRISVGTPEENILLLEAMKLYAD